MIHTWSSEWPTEPGYYWFYGKRSIRAEKLLEFANVRQAQNSMIYIVGGAFMYHEEGAVGMWMWIETPELP